MQQSGPRKTPTRGSAYSVSPYPGLHAWWGTDGLTFKEHLLIEKGLSLSIEKTQDRTSRVIILGLDKAFFWAGIGMFAGVFYEFGFAERGFGCRLHLVTKSCSLSLHAFNHPNLEIKKGVQWKPKIRRINLVDYECSTTLREIKSDPSPHEQTQHATPIRHTSLIDAVLWTDIPKSKPRTYLSILSTERQSPLPTLRSTNQPTPVWSNCHMCNHFRKRKGQRKQ